MAVHSIHCMATTRVQMGVRYVRTCAFAAVVAAFILFHSDVRHLEDIIGETHVGVNHPIRKWKSGNSSLQKTNYVMTNSSSAAATIIIHTSGELGNHMMHLAHAYSIAWLAERKYGMQFNMILHDQITRGRVNAKSYSVKKIIKKCFPNLQPLYDGPRANILPEYRIRIDQQQAWEMVNDTLLRHINNGIASERDVGLTLEHLQFLMYSNQIPEVEANSSIALPFIESTAMDNFEFVNWFYHELRQLFIFNDTECCLAVPDPNEIILVS